MRAPWRARRDVPAVKAPSTPGETLRSSTAAIATLWRCTRSNGITESFHNEMETITRQAYGSRNFENDRQCVQV